MSTEGKFPTIREYRDWLTSLVDQGLGELPTQVLVAPGTTVQAVARVLGDVGDVPALMIEHHKDGGIGPNMVASDYLHSSARATRIQ